MNNSFDNIGNINTDSPYALLNRETIKDDTLDIFREIPCGVTVQDANLTYVSLIDTRGELVEDKFIGKTDADLFSAKDAERLTKLKTDAMRSPTVSKCEIMLNSVLYSVTFVPKTNVSHETCGLIGYYRKIEDATSIDRSNQSRLENETLSFVTENFGFGAFQSADQRTVFDFMSVGFLRASRSGKILLCNDILAKMSGCSTADEMTENYTVYDFYSEDWQLPESDNGGSTNIRFVKSESDYKKTDGSIIFARIVKRYTLGSDGEILYADAFIKDIGDGKTIQSEYNETLKKLEAALTGMSDAVFISDTEGHFINFNDAFATFHRFESKEECAKTLEEYPEFLEVYLPDGSLASLDQWAVPRALRGESATGAEFTLRRKDTGETWIGSYNYAPIKDDQNNIIGSVVTARDITESKRLNKELTESESVMKLFVENVPASVAMFDNDMCYLACSNRWLKDFNLTVKPEDLKGVSHYKMFPEIGDRWKKIHVRCLKGEIITCEEDAFIREDGSKHWLKWEVRPWFTSEKKIGGMIIFSEDITERINARERIKQSNEELRISEEKFRNIFRKHSAVKLLIDAETRNIVDANEAASRYYGWSIDELVTMNVGDINTLSEEQITDHMKLVASGDRSTIDFRHRLKDGSIRDVTIFTSPIVIAGRKYIHSIVHDITEQKKIENELKLAKELADESRAQFSTAFYSSPISLSILSAEGSRVVAVNDACCMLYGYSQDELLNLSVADFIIWAEPEERIKVMTELKNSGRLKSYEIEILNSLKESRTILFSAESISWHGEACYITSSIDISERKQAEDRLLKAKLAAEESDRLKSAFLQNMSHEIRTPLNGILGFSNLLQEENISRDEIREYTDIIIKSGSRLLDTIGKILDISKIETGMVALDNTTVFLNALTEDLYNLYANSAEEKGLTLELECGLNDDKSMIKSDECKLNRILSVLINNAIKFTDKGGVRFGYDIVGSEIVFFVKDTGCGIPEDLSHRIFKRFAQVDLSVTRGYEGTGLGLAISKGLAELMGGSVSFESQSGRGTEFRLAIPYVPADPEEDTPFEEFAEKRTDDLVVLIAEDDYTNFRYMDRILNSLNIGHYDAENGRIAVEKIMEYPEINFILMDIKMPELNGIEAARIIRTEKPEIPIIAVTAYATAEEKKYLLENGFDDYCSKPFDKDTLVGMINKHRGKMLKVAVSRN